jgi:hypothetical protein
MYLFHKIIILVTISFIVLDGSMGYKKIHDNSYYIKRKLKYFYFKLIKISGSVEGVEQTS